MGQEDASAKVNYRAAGENVTCYEDAGFSRIAPAAISPATPVDAHRWNFPGGRHRRARTGRDGRGRPRAHRVQRHRREVPDIRWIFSHSGGAPVPDRPVHPLVAGAKARPSSQRAGAGIRQAPRRRRRSIYPQPSWLKSLPSFRSSGQPRRALVTDPTLVLGYSCTGDHEAKSGVEDVIPAALPDSRSSR
jgi:hypothetical protein